MRPREGMSVVNPAQIPVTLMRPAMDAGQPPEPRGEIIGYQIAGKLYHPDDVLIVRAAL